jgi:hypothetical protein
LKILWANFEQDFNISNFREHNEKVLWEVELASTIDAERFRKSSTTNQLRAQTQSIDDQKWHIQRAQRSFLESLCTCDYEANKNMVPIHVFGTCEWLLGHQSFWKWWQGHICLLFVGLGPAMGKSVLARRIVDFLSSDDLVHIPEANYDKTVCYFFFGDEDSRRDTRSAILALLHQLLCGQPKLLDLAFKVNGTVFTKHSFGALWNTFLKILRGEQHVNIIWIIDGLDQCEERSRLLFLEKLTFLFQDPLCRSRLKVIITSRYQSSIHDILKESPSSKYFELLGQDGSDHEQIQTEIKTFINARLTRFIALRSKRINDIDDASFEVGDWISSKDNHNYLWVSFIFETLDKNAGLSRQDLKDIVNTLPKSCSDCYERTLSCSSHPQKSRTLLHAVVGAARPLTIFEMNYVLSLREEHKSLVDVDLVPEFNLGKTLQELCGFFINIFDGRIYLIHQTAKEFLMQDASAHHPHPTPGAWMHSLDAGTSHMTMARACLLFLQLRSLEIEQPLFDENFLSWDSILDFHGQWRENHANDIDIIDAYCRKHPFLQYAACHWHFHLEKCDPNDAASLVPIGLQICDLNSNIWKTWFGIFVRNWKHVSSIPPFTSTLQVASWLGFVQGVKQLLAQQEFSSDEKCAALALASLRGHRNITKLFYEYECPRLSRARRLREIDAALKQVDTAFRDACPEIREYIDIQVQMLRQFQEQLVEEMELAADARYFPS